MIVSPNTHLPYYVREEYLLANIPPLQGFPKTYLWD